MADNLNTETLPKFDVERAVNRLRVSKAEYTKSETENGIADGALWAQDCADYAQLEKLAQAEMSDWWDSTQQEDGKFAEWLDGLLKMESPNSIFDSYSERGIYPSDEFACGFVDGALAVFAAVRSKL